ncbi:hypothetical protein BC937DRAFT_89876 [Endogone sp. FLAS-F59071]|nr:hypothetical protein BC937DRAFT_89876 [Endogone sp. FLAS-F59071]|eukprot:RUS17518.1 hypothetical protein BC937DRAFT_89876 [Endogone sp. FLAS-F59071]
MDVDISDPQQAALERPQRSKKIANIVEAYFSDSSLLWDKLLLSKIEGDPGGFVEIAWLSRQSRLKSLKCTPQEIVVAVTTYSFPKLKVNERQFYRTPDCQLRFKSL